MCRARSTTHRLTGTAVAAAPVAVAVAPVGVAVAPVAVAPVGVVVAPVGVAMVGVVMALAWTGERPLVSSASAAHVFESAESPVIATGSQRWNAVALQGENPALASSADQNQAQDVAAAAAPRIVHVAPPRHQWAGTSRACVHIWIPQ
jgi:hypothetical protein